MDIQRLTPIVKIYVKAFLLDATAIVINQNNISNEVNGSISGYTYGHISTGIKGNVSGRVSGSTKGKIETKTTHFANISFARNKER